MAIELAALTIDGGDIAITGFEVAEVDQILLDHEASSCDPLDMAPELPTGPVVTQRGDLWVLGGHRLMCGDARDKSDLQHLYADDRPAMLFTDPPYNLRIAGLVGRGKRKHEEFQMASGEMSTDEFSVFLEETLGLAATMSADGAIHFVCMDWRSIDLLLTVSRRIYGAVLNVAVWVKSNAGQGSFYRSQHELIGVLRVGEAA